MGKDRRATLRLYASLSFPLFSPLPFSFVAFFSGGYGMKEKGKAHHDGVGQTGIGFGGKDIR